MRKPRALLYGALVTLTAAIPAPVHAQGVILLLRHAERVDYEDKAGLISETGHARARKLVETLRDARITAIFTSEYARTMQTAEPLSKALNIPLTSIGPVDPKNDNTNEAQVRATIDQVRTLRPTDVVVVVGHQNTVVMILKALGAEQDFTVGDREHDDIFVVVPARDGPPKVVRLNY